MAMMALLQSSASFHLLDAAPRHASTTLITPAWRIGESR